VSSLAATDPAAEVLAEVNSTVADGISASGK